MLFIIFGMRPRYHDVGEGEFYCPTCRAQRHYVRKRATRWFTVYFIPLIPLGSMGEVVICEACGVTFKPQVLEQKPPAVQPRQGTPSLAAQINTLPQRLAAGEPLEFIVRDLTAAGVDRDAALQMLAPHLTGPRKKCDTCGLTYASTVTACQECGKPL